MTTAFYIGQRLRYDGALCTVRYHGPLSGLKGDWLGVEWDRTDRGKHDGCHRGQRIFHCLSKSTTAASFVRSTRKVDPTRTVLEALRHKYGSKATTNGNVFPGVGSEAEIVRISGKAVEEVGFEKIQQQIGHFEDLKIVLLDELTVFGLTRETSSDAIERASQEFARTCPNITELDLGWNLFENWQDISDVCKYLPKLRILKAGGLRLKSFNLNTELSLSPFSNIEELHLNETLLNPDQILNILSCTTKPAFPNLRSLSLSLNELTNFATNQPALIFSSITTLALENNAFTTFDPLPSIFHHFPALTTLSLQSNLISSIGSLPPATAFPTLTNLSLASNSIPTYTFLSNLPTLFPSLTSLRTSSNPFTTSSNPSAPSDAAYYLTLARIPSLQVLNYTTITPREREEGEIYYLSIAEKDIKHIITTSGLEAATAYTKQEYSRYSELCEKYDRPSILSSSPSSPSVVGSKSIQAPPPGSLASRVVQCTFYIAQLPPSTPSSTNNAQLPDSSSSGDGLLTYTRPIPRTINVYTLKSLVSRHFGHRLLKPLQFKLIAESDELDPIPETTRKVYAGGAGTGMGKDGGGGGGGEEEQMKRQREREWARWGDWDVDIPDPEPLSGSGSGSGLAEGAAAGEERGEGEEDDDGEEGGGEGEGKWVDGVLYRDGAKWKRRETEIVDGMRAWGDYLDGGESEVRIRVEPR